MPHDIKKLVFVGVEPWHGLGTKLPRNASYEEVADAAGFFKVVETPVFVPGKLEPVADVKTLVRVGRNSKP